MNDYNQRKKYLKDRIDFNLSLFGFGVYCDYAICNRIDGEEKEPEINIDCLHNLKNGNKLFINACVSDINSIFATVIDILKINQIKLIFYIMYEPSLPYDYILQILPYTINIFLMNNKYDHPLIHNMPIGIRDGEEVRPKHKHFSQKCLLEEKKQIRDKKYLCLLCFSATHIERLRCSEILGDQKFVLNLNKQDFSQQLCIHCGKVPIDINYQKTHESFYVLSPQGCGVECHRFYEAIYLNAIPIVKRTNTVQDKTFNAFPCLIVNDWNEVTEELLENSKEKMIKKLIEFKEKYPNFMTDIDSISDLLLEL